MLKACRFVGESAPGWLLVRSGLEPLSGLSAIALLLLLVAVDEDSSDKGEVPEVVLGRILSISAFNRLLVRAGLKLSERVSDSGLRARGLSSRRPSGGMG